MRNFINLVESFTTASPITWVDHSEEGLGLLFAEFQIDDGHYRVEFKRAHWKGPHWHVSFERNASKELSQTGNAMAVLSMVMRAVEEFLDSVNPKAIELSASLSDPSRLSLYPKLIERLISRHPKYKLKSSNDSRSGYRTYWIERPIEAFVPPPEPPREEPEQIDPKLSDEEWDDLVAFMDRDFKPS